MLGFCLMHIADFRYPLKTVWDFILQRGQGSAAGIINVTCSHGKLVGHGITIHAESSPYPG
jgi:hypothetical protein